MARIKARKPVRQGRQLQITGHQNGVVATVDLGTTAYLQRDFLYGGLNGVLIQIKTVQKHSQLIIATTSSSQKGYVEKVLLRILPAAKVGKLLDCWGTGHQQNIHVKGLVLGYMFWRLRHDGY